MTKKNSQEGGSKQSSFTKVETDEEVKNSDQYMLDLRKRLDNVMELANKTLQSSQASHARYKKCFDRSTKSRSFECGDSVFILLPANANKFLMQ